MFTPVLEDNEHYKIIKYLIEKYGCNYNCLLKSACFGGNLELIKYLLENYGEKRVSIPYTCQQATVCGWYKIVKYLVEKYGCSSHIYATRIAIDNGHYEVVKYLVEKCKINLFHINTYSHYLKYVSLCDRMQRKKASTRIYFWWVRACYNPNSLCGQRSMYKGYREYLSIC